MPQVIPFIAANASWLVPAATTAGSLGGTYLMGREQSKRSGEAAEDARRFYQQTSLPSQAAVSAQAVQNRGALGQARLGAYQNLSKELASRGFGSGSGLGIKGAGDIESAYLRGLGQSQTELTKFANTRQFAPGADAYGYSVPGGTESMLGGMGGLLNTALGMYMANKMLGLGRGGGGGAAGGGPTGPSGSFWDFL